MRKSAMEKQAAMEAKKSAEAAIRKTAMEKEQAIAE